ncbi:H-NS family nucleoid-associated regulatory protein [Reyranella sp.]|uniref:H-NS histone family protein n=1 Tax=Reyranella sp. TaxID=1929291 RepID=UPI003D0B4035
MSLSLEAIRKQIAKLEAAARERERSNMKGIKAAAKVIAKYDLSMSDLKMAMNGHGRRGRSPMAGKSVAPKYRDSKGNTWAGRGRPPLWLVAAEKTGRKRESFLIK